MKFFIDSADLKEIEEAEKTIGLDGITTNPSLLAKAVTTQKEKMDLKGYIQKVVDSVKGDVSLETLSNDAEGMVKEGRNLMKFGKNVVVKVPLTVEGLKAVRALKKEGIRTNVTLCFTPNQALLAAKAGAYIVSPFVGRLDDISQKGMQIIEEIVQIYQNYKIDTQVLVASIRHPIHVHQAALIGADIATIPLAVIKQLLNHPKTDEGQKRFLEDAGKVPEYGQMIRK